MLRLNTSLSDCIYRHLERSIVEGSLQPREKLIEQNLAKEFGVSRPPIREAFRLLQKEGLITILARRGAYVADLTPKDAEDIYAIRAYLEPLAVRLSFPQLKPKDFSFMDHLLEKMKMAIMTGDFGSFQKLDTQFHSRFFRKANNNKLEQLHQMFSKQIARLRFVAFRVPIRLKKSLREHQMIYSALRNQDLPLTETLVREHIENAGKDLVAYLKSLREENPSKKQIVS